MGNCSGRIASKKPIKLLDSQGELKLISAPVTAAEVMLDTPGYAVAPVEGISLTRRIAVVKADEGLASGKAYLLVPVDRIGSRVSEIQLAEVLRSVYGSGEKKGAPRRRRKSGSKVLPENTYNGSDCEKVEVVDLSKSAAAPGGGVEVVGGCRRWRNLRPWTPVLEPISEAC